MYQILRVCLAELGIIEGNTRYLQHPIVKHIYHNGNPYLIEGFKLLRAFDDEHQLRGGKRSADFYLKIKELEAVIFDPINMEKFSAAEIPPYFIYGTKKIEGEAAYKAYQQLLFYKWQNDQIAPRCHVHHY